MGNIAAKLGVGRLGSPGLTKGFNPIGLEEGPAQAGGLISRMVQAPDYNNLPVQAPVEAAPVESPRQRAARQAAQKAARGNPVQSLNLPPRSLPTGKPLPTDRINPVEATGRKMVTNKLGMY